MSKQSYTITLKNNKTEKEGIQYLLDQNIGFFNPDKESRKAIMQAFDIKKGFSRAFDLVYIEGATGDTLKIDHDKMILVELKTTKKKLPNNPSGFFFGAKIKIIRFI